MKARTCLAVAIASTFAARSSCLRSPTPLKCCMGTADMAAALTTAAELAAVTASLLRRSRSHAEGAGSQALWRTGQHRLYSIEQVFGLIP